MKKLILALACALSLSTAFCAQQVISFSPTHGDTLPSGGAKINQNFSECYSNIVLLTAQAQTALINAANAVSQSSANQSAITALSASLASSVSNLNASIVAYSNTNAASLATAISNNTVQFSLVTSNITATSSNLLALTSRYNTNSVTVSNSIVALQSSLANLQSAVTNLQANSVTNPVTDTLLVMAASYETNSVVYNAYIPTSDPVFPGPISPWTEGATNDYTIVITQGIPTNAVLNVPSSAVGFYCTTPGLNFPGAPIAPLPPGARVCVSHVPYDTFSDYINFIGTNATSAIPAGIGDSNFFMVGFYTNSVFPIPFSAQTVSTSSVPTTVQFNKGIYIGN